MIQYALLYKDQNTALLAMEHVQIELFSAVATFLENVGSNSFHSDSSGSFRFDTLAIFYSSLTHAHVY